MMYSIYTKSTGQIVKIVQTDDISAQLTPNESFLEGSFNDSSFYVKYGVATAIPPKPGQYYVFDFNTEQWVQSEILAKSDALMKRQRLLYASDWTQIPNGPLTPTIQSQWSVYRQELRDITAQSGYPFNIVWPVAPTGN